MGVASSWKASSRSAMAGLKIKPAKKLTSGSHRKAFRDAKEALFATGKKRAGCVYWSGGQHLTNQFKSPKQLKPEGAAKVQPRRIRKGLWAHPFFVSLGS